MQGAELGLVELDHVSLTAEVRAVAGGIGLRGEVRAALVRLHDTLMANRDWIKPHVGVAFKSHEAAIIGNTCLYGATGGQLFAAGLIPGMRGVYGGRLRNAGQVEAFTANLISMNRRYKAHAGVRITDV